MAKEHKDEKPHSAEHLVSEWRDFWWNADFLALMAERWNLTEARAVLDVGCGRGHWLAALFPYLHAQANCVGVDREETWVRDASESLSQRYPDISKDRYRFIVGDVHQLPFEDGSFDIVTCQTLIIHLSDPLRGLAEMKRVTKGGGSIICSEPENIRNSMALDSLTINYPVEKKLAWIEYLLRWEEGKYALGEGHSSIGSMVPGYLNELGFTDIQTYVSDKAIAQYPPYQTREQKASINDQKQHFVDQTGLWDKNRAQRYVIASGATNQHFEDLWKAVTEIHIECLAAIEHKSWSFGGAGVQYLVSGRKPA